MSKNCQIEFIEGELTCLCNHRDYRNCDLYEEDEETYDDWGEEEERMSIEITDELIELVEEHKHYGTDATARHLAAYICEELDKEEE